MELVGTFFIVFVAASSGSPIGIAVTYAIFSYVGSHVSGGQYNPALTFGLFTIGKLRGVKALSFIIAQLLGGALALVAFTYLGGKDFIIKPSDSATLMQAGLAEMMFTFLFVTTVLFTMISKKSAGNSYFGLVAGFTLLIGSLTVGPLSGGAFNPVLGVSSQIYRMIMGHGLVIENVILYTIAPVLGALLAVQFYELVVDKNDK